MLSAGSMKSSVCSNVFGGRCSYDENHGLSRFDRPGVVFSRENSASEKNNSILHLKIYQEAISLLVQNVLMQSQLIHD